MIKNIIRKYNHLDSKHSGQLTNHLNMGLYALSELGATERNLHDFAEKYINQKEVQSIQTSRSLISDENLYEWLGRENSYSEFVGFYMKKMENNDPREIFKIYINKLKDGFAGGAFHGLIRAAYAFELDDPEELAKSLAYLSEVYLKFEIDFTTLKEKDPLETILHFSKSDHFKDKEFKRSLITGRMIDIFEDKEFKASRLSPDLLNCNSLYETMLTLYSLTFDFTILHGFTSSHALAVLQPLLTNFDQVLERHWFNIQTAYLSTNCTKILDRPLINADLEWSTIFNTIKTSDDVHELKLVYSLSEMSHKYGQAGFAKTIASML